jgi:hypothetical protein
LPVAPVTKIIVVVLRVVAPLDRASLHPRRGEGGARRAGGHPAVEKAAVPTVGRLAGCKDTGGNIFGLTKSVPNGA